MLTLAVFIMLPAKVRAADQTITRVQWLHDLTELFNMTVEEDNYPDNYFSDISEQDEYYRDVMVATEFGLVDVEAGYELKPQEPVTREFAAYTMNMCMGYVLDQNASYTFSDKTDFEHQDDEHYQSAQVAINRGWISVSGGKFNPGANLTQTEKNAMWSDAKKHMESEKIDEGYNNKVTFADGVIEIPKDTEYEFEEYDTGKFVTLFNYTGELEDGDTFALWVNGLPAIYKAVAVEDMGSGLVIQFQNGDENTAITEMDAQGTVEADLATAVQNGEGTMSWIAGGSEEKNYEDGREISDPRLAGNVAIKAIKRSIPVKLADGLSASISVTIPKPTVNYKVNGIQEVYVALNADTTAAVTVKGDAIENLGLPSSIDLVYIPIGGIGAARISISVAASGQCVLNYNFNAVAGVHYTRGCGTSLVTSFTKKSFTISAQAEISATVSATLGVTSIPKINASIWAKVGPRMGLNAWTYGDNKTPKACMDTYAYVYAGAGATLKVLSKDYSPKPYEIWTKNNSPVRVAAHYEDGRWVQACTRDASDRRYYTKMSSQYFSDPSGYYDSSNYSGNAASAVQPRYEYTLSKNEEGEDVATITKYYGTVSAITVPGVIDGYTVVAIGDGAFKGNRYLATAMLPDSVKEIGNDAFANSGLTSLILPSNLEVMRGDILSGNTGVRELTIPKTVKVMRDKNLLPTGSLNGSSVETVIFEKGITRIPSCGAKGAKKLTSVSIPETVTEIDAEAFQDCTALKTIDLSQNLTTIGNGAFVESGLTSLTLPNSVKKLGTYIFGNCISLETMTLPDSITTIPNDLFAGCKNLKTINLSKNITRICAYSFKECDSLTEMTIPSGVTRIDEGAFFQCDSLKCVNLPDTLTNLGYRAFYNCDALTAVKIPNSVTDLGNQIFYDCDALTDVTLGTKLKKLPDSTFEHCDALVSVTLPYGIQSIGNSAFKTDISLTSVTIPRSTTSIGSSVFSYPEKMTIYGVAGTYAETYANENGIKFVSQEINASKVTLNQSSVTINKRKTYALKLTVEPSDCTDEVIWKSTNSDVASVDGDGLITAKAIGTATIRVTVGKVKATCAVKVVQPVTSISLNKSNLTMNATETYQLSAKAYPETAENTEIDWKSEDETIASVDQNGMVMAKKKGSTNIVAEAKDGSGVTGKCRITVNNTAYFVKSIDELESPHNYSNNSSDIWIYTAPASQNELTITFDERTEVEEDFDYIYLLSGDGTEVGKYTGTQLSGKTIKIPGNTVKIKLVSDDAGTEWGFKVKSINEKPELTVALSVDPVGSIVSGRQVRLIAEASGGSGKYTYKFLVCDDKNNWYRIQDYGTSNTCTWIPGTAGKKTLYVDVKDSDGSIKRAELLYEVKNKEVPLTVKFTASPSASAASGSEVKLTAEVSGGNRKYTYKFLICDDKDNWYRIQDYGTSNTCTWVPGATGKKMLYVDVKDSNGSVKRAGLSYEIKNKEVPLTVKFTTSPSASTISGSQVKLIAEASGGSGKYTYKFIVYSKEGGWYKLRDFAESNTYIWNTGASGDKILYVDVKDSNGSVKRAELSYEIKDKEVPLTVKLTANPSTSVTSGSEVKLTAEASGGSGKYTYKFLVCDDKNNWYKIQDYGISNICTWIPGATGKKTLYVDAKDSTGTVKRTELGFEVLDPAKVHEGELPEVISEEKTEELTNAQEKDTKELPDIQKEISEQENGENLFSDVFSDGTSPDQTKEETFTSE